MRAVHAAAPAGTAVCLLTSKSSGTSIGPSPLRTRYILPGKSKPLGSLVRELVPLPAALVGIDCKGGMELSLFERRLSVLACSRSEAVALLAVLCEEAASRMAMCRAAGVRAIWDLPDEVRPVPLVVLVDQVAELHSLTGSKISREEAAECSTYLLRIAQLGAALVLHLIVAGQRLGSELGAGGTALRAQLGGRICDRVHDEATAEVALGVLATDAIEAAQTITEDEQGVAVTSMGGTWVRARSRLTSAATARRMAELHADLTPDMPAPLRAVISATYRGRHDGKSGSSSRPILSARSACPLCARGKSSGGWDPCSSPSGS